MANLHICLIYALELMGGQQRLACVPDLGCLRGLIREFGITVPILDELPERVQKELLDLSRRQLSDPDWPALGLELDRIT